MKKNSTKSDGAQLNMEKAEPPTYEEVQEAYANYKELEDSHTFHFAVGRSGKRMIIAMPKSEGEIDGDSEP